MSLGSVASSYRRPYWNISNALAGYGGAALTVGYGGSALPASGPTYQASYGSLNKYSSNGTQIWKKVLSNGSTYSMDLDGSGNIYLGSTSGSNKATVTKLFPDGTILWSITLGDGNIYGIDVDVNGYIYAVGYLTVSSLNYAFAIKLDSDGVIQWSFKNNTSTTYYNDVAWGQYSSSSYLGLAGTNFNSGTGVGMFLVLNADNGSVIFQKNITQNSGHSGCQSIAFEPTLGRFYVATFSNGVGNFSALCFSNSGLYEWGSSFPPGTSGLVGYGGLDADYDGNCYLTNYDGQFIKLNALGSGIFQRQITLNGISAIGGSNISVGDNPYFATAVIPSFFGGITKLTASTSNSGLGTYSWGTYTASSISISSYSGSVSSSSYSFTTGAVSATSVSPTVTTTYPTPTINRIIT